MKKTLVAIWLGLLLSLPVLKGIDCWYECRQAERDGDDVATVVHADMTFSCFVVGDEWIVVGQNQYGYGAVTTNKVLITAIDNCLDYHD